MYHSKKIGVFISHIFGFYQRNVCQGIIDKALEYGYTAEIFTSLDGENSGAYGIGEESILRIPNFDSFDGIIFASDTYISLDLKNKILGRLQGVSCPVMEIAVTDNHFPAVSLENSTTAGELTEHLLTVHQAPRICYLGCKEEPFFSDKREASYREALRKYAKEPGAYDIYHAHYAADSVRDALHFFCTEEIPHTVVCYNDRLALTFMAEALACGYRVPEDIAITGCDDTPEGHNASPMLTTVSFPVYELGVAAVNGLFTQIRGNDLPFVTYLTAKPIYRNSCGCKSAENANSIFFMQELSARVAALESSILGSMNMSAELQNVTDIDEGMDLLEKYVKKIEHCSEFYLCLYSDWDSVSDHILELTDTKEKLSDSDTIQLKLAMKNGKRLPECSYRKKDLLPGYIYDASDCAYIYTPLFFEDKEFGYLALSYEDNRIDYHFRLVQWQININQMLQKICEKKRTGLLINRLEDIYMIDSLTGLYNKYGYSYYQKQLLNKAIAEHLSLTAVLFDMDDLKIINNTYGHNEGDFAIQVLGHALESAIEADDLCARFSGDEFYLLTAGRQEDDVETVIKNIKDYLKNYNKLSSKEYRVCCSCGFASVSPGSDFTAENIRELFSAAEKKMYEEKELHHASRK